MKRYRVTLTAAEREELDRLLSRGKADVRKLKHAQVLLRADEAGGGPGWSDARIAEAVGVGVATVQRRLRQRFVEDGLDAALRPHRVGQRLYQRKLDGRRAGGPPHRPGLRGAAGGARALDVAPAGPAHGRVAVHRHAVARDGAPDAEKNALKPRPRRRWCIPPKPSAEFVCHMEDVLAAYCRPCDPKRPVVCLDETFKQLVGETREPPAARPGAVERYDHICTRNGVASLFRACEPLAGWRHVAVAEHRRRGDWAEFVRDLLEGRHRDAERVVLIMDRLNTHAAASLYEAFPPDEARRLAERLEIHHTPKHGSWLNMAEIELSAPGRQCLARRIAHQDTLRHQIARWEEQRNAVPSTIRWHFTTDQARIRLRSLYPSLDR